MISTMAIGVTMCNTCSYFRSVGDILADVWVVVYISAETLCIHLITVGSAMGLIVSFAERLNFDSAGTVIVLLAGMLVGFGVNMISGVCVIVSVTALDIVVPESYSRDVRTDIDALADRAIVVVPYINVDLLSGMVANTALESTPMLASSEKAFCFSCKICRWRSTAAWNCCDLQTRIPSYHVLPRDMLPALRQFPYQEPPCPQQLILPDFLMMPHSRHTGPMGAVVLTARISMWKAVKHTKRALWKSLPSVRKHESTDVNLRLTFAGLNAFKPAVTEVVVACTSTILMPRTARSATTDSTSILERAALGTDCSRRSVWRGGC